MAYSFANIPRATPPRSVFRRNHNIKTTINTDFLYPIYVDECLPGDVFKFKQHIFARLSTPLTPVMDNLYLDTFFFAVPVRLVDKEFKRLMGERPFGDVRNDYTVPQLAVTPKSGSLSDYLGLPLLPDGKSVSVCPWWHRAYNLVYNEWFRDENLCPARPIAGLHEDGTQTEEAESDYILCRRGKRKDYFTGCLPWPQKGDASGIPVDFANGSIRLPGSAFAPTLNLVSPDGVQLLENVGIRSSSSANSTSTQVGASIYPVGTENNTFGRAIPSGSVVSGFYHDYDAVVTFPQSAQVTINQLRESVAIQHFLETEARGGCSRYVEVIRAHFNVVSPDARQQRPEYLGGTSQPLNVTTVAQTSSSTDKSPQGNLAAFVTANSNAYWTKTFTEHTIIIGLANVRADLSYQQGVPRMFSRRTKYDFYWPELANLGEQSVLNKEIFAQGTEDDNETFGYQERWAEYRYHPNTITGQFRSTAAETLDYWHLAQKFDSLPTLSQEFIEEHVPIDRVLAVNTSVAPNMILDGWFELETARLMPLYSVPGLGRL
mgnify:CR=1 FL=1